jgi:hypothetical protein
MLVRCRVNRDTISPQIRDMNNFATINEVRLLAKALKALYELACQGFNLKSALLLFQRRRFITILICIWHGYLVLCKFVLPDCNLSSFMPPLASYRHPDTCILFVLWIPPENYFLKRFINNWGRINSHNNPHLYNRRFVRRLASLQSYKNVACYYFLN